MHSNTNILSKGICICMRIIVFGGTGRQRERFRSSKGLAKEKETLEASLKAITAAVNEEKESEKAGTDTECETDAEIDARKWTSTAA